MTAAHFSSSAAAGLVAALSIPNPIAAAVYALIAAAVGWFVAQLLNYIKSKLGL